MFHAAPKLFDHVKVVEVICKGDVSAYKIKSPGKIPTVLFLGKNREYNFPWLKAPIISMLVILGEVICSSSQALTQNPHIARYTAMGTPLRSSCSWGAMDINITNRMQFWRQIVWLSTRSFRAGNKTPWRKSHLICPQGG